MNAVCQLDRVSWRSRMNVVCLLDRVLWCSRMNAVCQLDSFTYVVTDSHRSELLVKTAWTGSQDLIYVTGKNCLDRKPGLNLCYW